MLSFLHKYEYLNATQIVNISTPRASMTQHPGSNEKNSFEFYSSVVGDTEWIFAAPRLGPGPALVPLCGATDCDRTESCTFAREREVAAEPLPLRLGAGAAALDALPLAT